MGDEALKRRRHDDQGAEGAEEGGCGEDCALPSPHWGGAPLHWKQFYFGSQKGEFWCKLGAGEY